MIQYLEFREEVRFMEGGGWDGVYRGVLGFICPQLH